MRQPEPSSGYESYLLRLRWAQRGGEPVCQVMLQSVSTKEQNYFSDLESLVSFLRSQAGDPGSGLSLGGEEAGG